MEQIGAQYVPRPERVQTSIWSHITTTSVNRIHLAERKMGLFKQKTTNGGKTSNWNLIDWNEVTRQVCEVQTRLVKAMKQGNWKQVRSLQRLLTHSTAAKLLAVRQVTSNRGK